MQILGLLRMYFDAVVVEVDKYLLFFRYTVNGNMHKKHH